MVRWWPTYFIRFAACRAYADAVSRHAEPTLGGFVTFATPQEERLLAMAMIPLTGLIIAGVHAVHLHFAARAGEY